jgi:hypothetical protein
MRFGQLRNANSDGLECSHHRQQTDSLHNACGQLGCVFIAMTQHGMAEHLAWLPHNKLRRCGDAQRWQRRATTVTSSSTPTHSLSTKRGGSWLMSVLVDPSIATTSGIDEVIQEERVANRQSKLDFNGGQAACRRGKRCSGTPCAGSQATQLAAFLLAHLSKGKLDRLRIVFFVCVSGGKCASLSRLRAAMQQRAKRATVAQTSKAPGHYQRSESTLDPTRQQRHLRCFSC